MLNDYKANRKRTYVDAKRRINKHLAPFFGNELAFDVNNVAHRVRGCDFNMEAHWRRFGIPEYSNSHPTAQETNLFRNFADQVRRGTLNADWPMWAERTQQVTAACLESARAGGSAIEPG